MTDLTNISSEGNQSTDQRYLAFLQGYQTAFEDILSQPEITFGAFFEQQAASQPDHEALVFGSARYTYQALDKLANQFAAWGIEQGLKQGDTIAIALNNCPEMIACFIGFSKIGVVMAMINPEAHGVALEHVLNIANPRLILADAEKKQRITDLGGDHAGLTHDLANDISLENISPEAAQQRVADNKSSLGSTGDLCLIYTSGTTGLPKAAALNNKRVIGAALSSSCCMGLDKQSRVYVCLPLCHTNGLSLGMGATILAGGCVVLKEKLSVSEFWSDCVREQVTNFVYIGDLCRFLNNYHQTAAQLEHSVKCIFGNGLPKDVWLEFTEKFNIPKVVEFYSSTESNVSLLNLDGVPGSVGYVPAPFLEGRRLALLKYDTEEGAHILDDQGGFLACGDNEVGELVGVIEASDDHQFYTQESETQKKILTDVFAPGDRYFKTGDLMKRDSDGWFYFVDRIGDTFRWRGENVSTVEVEAILRGFPGVNEACVYGVEVPNEPGRAGMASLVTGEGFDLQAFHEFVASQVAKHARPLFIRLQNEIAKTATMKPLKVPLQREGIDPQQHDDPMYWNTSGEYQEYSQAVYQKICAGSIKF